MQFQTIFITLAAAISQAAAQGCYPDGELFQGPYNVAVNSACDTTVAGTFGNGETKYCCWQEKASSKIDIFVRRQGVPEFLTDGDCARELNYIGSECARGGVNEPDVLNDDWYFR